MKLTPFVQAPSALQSWNVRSHGRGIAFVATCGFIFVALLTGLIVAMPSGATSLFRVLTASVAIPVLAFAAISLARLILRYLLKPLPAEACCVPLEQAPILAVPVIIRSDHDIEAIVDNVDANLPFSSRKPMVFLLDLPDALSAVVPDDRRLLDLLQQRLSADISAGRVAVLTRRRVFDPVDRAWRGWERKRGKIEEFCRLLLADGETSFEQPLPDTLVESGTFVTIDIDTRLLPGTIASLVAAIDREAAIVTPMLEDRCRPDATLFERLVALSSRRHAYDPNHNFNQSRLGYDLYYGKGLIVAERFLARTEGRIAERTILSHDHLESMLAGAVLSPQAIVREDIPRSREQWARRQFRWIRGDFQIVPWIVRSRLPVVARLHLSEVVLGHLAAPCSVLLAMIVLTVPALPAPTSFAYAFSCLAMARPSLLLLPVTMPSIVFNSTKSWPERLAATGSILASEIAAWTLSLVYAPGNLVLILRAAALVSWRLGWSGQKLLEWECDPPASHKGRRGRWVSGVRGLAGIIFLGTAFLMQQQAQFIVATISLWLLIPLLLLLRLPRGSQPMSWIRKSSIPSKW